MGRKIQLCCGLRGMLVCLIVAAFGSHCLGQGAFPSIPGSATNDAGVTMPYRIIFPRNYDPLRAYPLFFFLHSGGEVGTDNVSQVANTTAQIIAERSQLEPYASIFVAPQTTIGFSSELANELLHLVIQDVEGSYLVDTRRRYVTGYSLGGIGTWDLIGRDPAFFAAAAPVAGFGNPTHGPGLAHMPTWAFHGEFDDVIPVSGSRDMISAIRAAGGIPRYTEYRGSGHDAWTPTYVGSGQTLFDWMFAQVRPVPEPTTGLVLGMATCLLAWRMRTREKTIL